MAGPSEMKTDKKEYSLFLKLFACLLYACSSSGLTFINKSLYVKFKFQSPLDLLLSQCFCNVLICSVMMFYKQWNPNSFQFFESIGMRISPATEVLSKMRLGIGMGMANLVSVLFGLFSVKLVNIPLFLTFRRCSILTTVLMGWLINSTVPDSKLQFSLVLTVIGAIIAGYETFNTQWFGYFLVWMNNLSQSVYNVIVHKINNEKKVTPFEINFYFALCGLPISLAITLYTGEINHLFNVFKIPDLSDRLFFLLYIVLSGAMGIVITIGVLMVCTICSPVAFNITGNMKDVVLTYIGFMFFDDVSLTFMVGLGLAFSFCGAGSYALDSYWKERAKHKAKAKKE